VRACVYICAHVYVHARARACVCVAHTHVQCVHLCVEGIQVQVDLYSPLCSIFQKETKSAYLQCVYSFTWVQLQHTMCIVPVYVAQCLLT